MGSLLDQILLGLDNTKQGKLTPAKDIAPKPASQAPGQKASSPPPEPPKKKSKVASHKHSPENNHPHTHRNKPPSPTRADSNSSWRAPRAPPSEGPELVSIRGSNSPPSTTSDRKSSGPASPTRDVGASKLATPSTSPITASSSPTREDFELPVCRAEPIVVRTGDETVAAIRVLRKAPVVAIDCEAVGMSRHGKLCLVQVASRDSVYLFDVVEGGDAIFDKGLRWLLESTNVLKIVHDCRGDAEILFYKHQVSLTNVVDTQVAFCVYSRQQGGMTPIPVALNTLIKRFAHGATNTFKEIVRDEMEASPNYWEIRPMSHNMIQYASQDVIYLPYVWSQMEAALSPSSKKVVAAMSLRYLNQYRSMEERPAPPERPKSSPTKAAELAPSPSSEVSVSTQATADLQASAPIPIPSSPAETSSTDSSNSPAIVSASPASPASSPRFVPKYGIEEWDRSVAQNLEFSSVRGSRGNFPRRRRD